MAQRGNFKGAKARAAERRLQCLELKKAGASNRQIGTQLKVSHTQVCRDLQRALAAIGSLERHSAEEARLLEQERLDIATLAISQQVRAGNFGAVDRWVRLSERRSKLLGLDKPIKIAPTNIEGTESYDAGLTADQLFEKLMANFNGAGEVGLPEEAGRGEAPEDSGSAGA